MQHIITDHIDSILCIYFINNNYIATGSKDKTINIYNLEGKKIINLKGHQASICTLSSIKNINNTVFLCSGGDHGCSSLIIWDCRSWTINTHIKLHTAAITSIIDLQDNKYLLTASYDKKICLYDYMNKKVQFYLQNNKTSITSMIINYDKTKLITSGLDNTLTIWNIIRKNYNITNILNQKIINNNALICQLQCSQLRNEIIFAGTRDGTIKMINIDLGQIEKNYLVNSNSIIEMIIIEKEMQKQSPLILSCSAKDNIIISTRMDTGKNIPIKGIDNLNIQFGCGIGPKIVFSQNRNGIAAILSQNNQIKQFYLYEIKLK